MAVQRMVMAFVRVCVRVRPLDRARGYLVAAFVSLSCLILIYMTLIYMIRGGTLLARCRAVMALPRMVVPRPMIVSVMMGHSARA